MSYHLSEIRKSDTRSMKKLIALLEKENISLDKNIEFTLGMFDEDYNLMATGSIFGNTLRCLAVNSAYQGEGLLNTLVTELMQIQFEKGRNHLFIYTKINTAKFFGDLGFYEIARVDDKLVFMENKKTGFSGYLDKLGESRKEGSSAALVMNCNPFTLGHQYLVEYAAKENDNVHLFVVSEDASLFPFQDRFKMVQAGTNHLKNVTLHTTESYLVSNAVFPSYFLKDEDTVIRSHTKLDAAIFTRIAQTLGITKRYAGHEPFSHVTNIYNSTMKEELPKHGIEFIELDRLEKENTAISASSVRQFIHDGKLEEIINIVPQSTYDYFFTEEGKKVVEKIKAENEVKHY